MLTSDKFLADVKDHQLEILKDDGVYRHIRMSKPNTRCMSYDIITYPGGLLYRGDMGEYVFERVYDMFNFFRDTDGDLKINPSYWAQKCITRNHEVKEFSFETYKSNVKDHFDMYFEDDDDNSHKADVWDEIETQLFSLKGDHECWAVYAIEDFYSKYDFNLDDFWEYDNKDYTHRYIWCLYAMVHAINEYDKEKNNGD